MSNLAINKDVYFDCDRKQLQYTINPGLKELPYQKQEYVNRYAIVRKDTGDVLGIHTDDYIVRPYATLAEGVNKIIEDSIDTEKYNITTKDHVYESGKKYRRDINFWNESIDFENYDKAGMHISGKEERIVPQLRIYSSMDGKWGQQIMWSSVYVVCLNGMVRPDWTFVVYNKHSKRENILFTLSDFQKGLEAHKELGEDLFKMMQKKVITVAVSHLFKKTLASQYARKSLIDHTSVNVMKDLTKSWLRYEQRYGSTLFAVYQTATDWSSHPVTKGAEHNVSRKREKQVAEMMTSSEWNTLAA